MSIINLLKPFTPDGTDENQRLTRVLNIINRAILATSLLGTVVGIVAGWQVALVVAVVTDLEVIVALLLLRKGKITASAVVTLSAILVTTNVAAWAGEGIHDVIIIALPGAIIIASLLGNLTIYIIFAVLIVLSPSAIIAAKHLSGIPYTTIAGEPANLFILTLILAATAVAMRLLADDLISSFRRAKESESRYKGIFASIRDCYFEMDLEGTVLEISPSGEKLLGESRSKILGTSIERFFVSTENSTDLTAYLRSPEPLENNETQIRDSSGAIHTVLLSTFTKPSSTDPTKIVGSFRDITGHRRLEEQLSMAQRMESVGTLAGGVAHDFNNLLTVINGNAEMSLDRLTSEAVDLRDELTGILEAGRRAAMLTSQLLTFSRRQVVEPEALDLNASIESLDQVVRPLIGADIHVKYHLADALPAVLADPAQVEQILINFLVNARDAIAADSSKSGAKRIDIATSVEHRTHSSFHDRERPTSPQAQDSEGQDFVVFSITDHGIGMAQEVQSRIYEPFYTTKETGTGLGLATVYGIVQQNNGHITLESREGHGTTFRVFWPCTGVPKKPELPREIDAVGGTETILLVEDEGGVRRLTAKALRSKGYTVREATNGLKALDILASTPIDLVITDMVMPKMGGKELMAAVREDHPSTRILLVSGYSTDQFDSGMASAKLPPMLLKPYTIKHLLVAVRDALDGNAING